MTVLCVAGYALLLLGCLLVLGPACGVAAYSYR